MSTAIATNRFSLQRSRHRSALRFATLAAIVSISLGRPTLSFTREISFFLFFFYQSTALSSRALDGYQMYSGGSVVGNASTIGIEISPTPPLIFTGGVQKVQNLASKISKFWNKSAVLRWSPYVRPRQAWWSWVHSPLRKLCQSSPPPQGQGHSVK